MSLRTVWLPAAFTILTASNPLGAQLPDGAVVRIGPPGVRVSDMYGDATVTPDGKLTVSTEGDRRALSPDGKLRAIGNDHHLVHVVGADSNDLLHVLKGHTAYISAVAFSRDAGTLATGSNDRTLRLWDLKSGEERHVCSGHDDQVCAIDFAPDGKTVASASWDGSVRLWDIATGKALRRLDGHRWEARCVAFSPDGKTLVSGASDGTLRVWDVATGKERRQWFVHPSGVAAVAFSTSGKEIVIADGEHKVRFWDLADAKELRSLRGEGVPAGRGTPYCAAFTPDGKAVAFGHYDGTIHMHDAANGKHLRIVGSHPKIVWSLAFSPDGKILASSARRHGVVRLWDVNTGKMVRSFPGHMGGISRVLFTPDGKQLIAAGGSYDPVILIHDTAANREPRRIQGHTGYVQAIALSPDGKTLASAAWDATIRLWDLATGKERRRWPGPSDAHARLAFTTDGAGLLAVDADGALCIYDVATGRQRRWLGGVPRWVGISADGRSLAGLAADSSIDVVEIATDSRRRRFHAGFHVHAPTGHFMAFSRDGRRLLTDNGDGSAWLWDLTRPARKAPATDDAWRDLADVDAARAYDAFWHLTKSPSESVALLREKLAPARPADTANLARHVADLDDDDVNVRQQAARELERTGEAARDLLEKARVAPPSAEVRQRVETLLAKLDEQAPSPDGLRDLRALEVLEAIGTPEARRVIDALSRGAAGARLTREARVTLERMPR